MAGHIPFFHSSVPFLHLAFAIVVNRHWLTKSSERHASLALLCWHRSTSQFGINFAWAWIDCCDYSVTLAYCYFWLSISQPLKRRKFSKVNSCVVSGPLVSTLISKFNRPWKSYEVVSIHISMSKCGGPAKKIICLAFDPAWISFQTWQSQQRTYSFSTHLSPSGFCHHRLVNDHWPTKSSEKVCNHAIEAFLSVAYISFGTGWKCVVSCLQCKNDFVTVCGHGYSLLSWVFTTSQIGLNHATFGEGLFVLWRAMLDKSLMKGLLSQSGGPKFKLATVGTSYKDRSQWHGKKQKLQFTNRTKNRK